MQTLFTTAPLDFWLDSTNFPAQPKFIGLHKIFGMYHVADGHFPTQRIGGYLKPDIPQKAEGYKRLDVAYL